MPGKDRIEEIVKEEATRIENMAKNIRAAIHPMGGATAESLDQCEKLGREALAEGVKHAKILVRERN